MKMNKAKMLICAAACVSAALVGCKGKDKTPVTHIGYFTGDICNAPMHVAIENGYFQEEFDAIGQKFDLISRIQATTSAGDLVASGKMDAGTDLIAAVLPQMENGLKITFTVGYHTGCTKYYAKPGSGITSVEDLRGKKVAIPGMSDSAYMNLKRKFAEVGIKTDMGNSEVEFFVYGTPDMPIALENGAVDAIGLHDPVAAIAEAEYGLVKILDIGEDPKFAQEYCCQAFVSQKLAKENPAAAAAFTRAIMRAAAFVQANPREAADLQMRADYVSGDIEMNTKILDDLYFVPSVSAGQQTLVLQATDLQQLGFLKPETNLQQFIAESYTTFDDVPDSYTYENGTFVPVY